MATAALKIHLSRTQILELARQLSDEDKLELNRALAAEVRGIKLKRLLDDLKTDEVLQEDIDSEVETVRQENYEKQQAQPFHQIRNPKDLPIFCQSKN